MTLFYLFASGELKAGSIKSNDQLAYESAVLIFDTIQDWKLDTVGSYQRFQFASEGKLFTGYLDHVKGKSKLITYFVILDESGTIYHIDVLVYRESYGGEIDHPSFREQFNGKSATDLPVWNRNIRNISGATISCRSITIGVQKILDFHQSFLAVR